MDAFRELSTSRPGGMDVQAIPFTAIVEYFRIYELQDFDEFLYIIRTMDSAFLDMNAEANKKSERDRDASRNADKKNNNKG